MSGTGIRRVDAAVDQILQFGEAERRLRHLLALEIKKLAMQTTRWRHHARLSWADTLEVLSPSEPLRILRVVNDASQAHQLSGVMAAFANTHFKVVNASNRWETLRPTRGGEYEALVIDCALGDTDCESLLGRLKALGVTAPALIPTAPGWVQRGADGDEQFAMLEALVGDSLVRAIVGMVRRHDAG